MSRRDVAVWLVCFVLAASLLVVTRFASDDGDSALYAGLGARLAQGPAHSWIAPEWWGFWNGTGFFREQPVGVFLPTIALARLGVPPVQAAYVVGIGCGLGALLMTGLLVGRISTARDGRAAMVLLQFIPLAFIFRIRANHEYPMLVCLLLTLLGLDRVRRSWGWIFLVVGAGTFALLVKSVFVVLLLCAAALWIVLNPTDAPGSRARPVIAWILTVAAIGAAAVGYDWMYVRATGEGFWGPFWLRQIGSATPPGLGTAAYAFVKHIGFYVGHLIWLTLPWSVALLLAAWPVGRLLAWWREAPSRVRRGVVFVLAFAVITIGLLSPAIRQAERYEFSAAYFTAALGAVVARHQWKWLAALVDRLDRSVPNLPALVWLALIVGRVFIGPFLPRVP